MAEGQCETKKDWGTFLKEVYSLTLFNISIGRGDEVRRSLPYSLVATSTKYRDDLKEGDSSDCLVRAIASCFKIEYRAAHRWCRLVLKREDGCGALVSKIAEAWVSKDPLMKRVVLGFVGKTPSWSFFKRVLLEGTPSQQRRGLRAINAATNATPAGKSFMTLGAFVKNVAEVDQDYLVFLNGHAVAVCDQVVYDNEDTRPMSRVSMFWRILPEEVL